MPLHRCPDGTQDYVTKAEAKRRYNEKRKYRRGSVAPNYPVPVPIDIAEYDIEYIWMLRERAVLIQKLRQIRGDTIN